MRRKKELTVIEQETVTIYEMYLAIVLVNHNVL
jgi:hypothetical protein